MSKYVVVGGGGGGVGDANDVGDSVGRTWVAVSVGALVASVAMSVVTSWRRWVDGA